MKKIYYLTYNEFNQGVYRGQVIATLTFLRSEGYDIKLVSLLPIRSFFSNRKWIKKQYKNSVVLPAIPTLSLLKLNLIFLFFLRGDNIEIIGRGPLATFLAILLRKMRKGCNRIIYDGRAAVAEEHREYGNGIKYEKLFTIEKTVVEQSDYRMSISEELINYWRRKFNYNNNKHVVIPCCAELPMFLETQQSILAKEHTEFFLGKIIIVFSGSTHAWQSYALNCSFLKKIMYANADVNVLFLSHDNEYINDITSHFGDKRVKRLWVPSDKVDSYLRLCDYGLLLRDDNITNKVAAPVKFAEYLSCGLKIIISEGIKDYAKFVDEHGCGYVIANNAASYSVDIKKNFEKDRMVSLYKEYFFRKSKENRIKYAKVFEWQKK